jgi:Tol biopolymer transport system component/DNA-binding winged helix-turn-helix (wHTH) protein
MSDSNHDRIRFGAFQVDLRTRELWKGGVKLKLGGQPFDILARLLEKPGQLVTREELRTKIWAADTFVDFNHGLNAAVNKLRECLSDSAEDPRYIETLPRRGYRFIAEIPAELRTSHASASSAEWLANRRVERPPTLPMERGKLTYLWAFLIPALFVALFLGWWKLNTGETAEARLKKVRETKFEQTGEVPRAPSIWHLDLTHAAEAGAHTLVTAARDRNEGPQPSPDGKKLAFMSDRSGGLEIWKSNLDGSELVKLTNMGNCGSPRWSPDSRWIAFDSIQKGHPGIFVASADGGQSVPKGASNSDDMVPSWSQDGKWIYFASNRSGETQVWKMSIDDGRGIQVTQHGGFAALESTDGQTVYYAKTRFASPEIWEVPAQGGVEKRVKMLLKPGTWANWAVTQTGIYFLTDEEGSSPSIVFFDFSTQEVQQVGKLDKDSFWFSASIDGTSAWYAQSEDEGNNTSLRIDYHPVQ